MVKKNNIITTDLKIAFNDICMRELGLDITEDARLFHIESNTILQFNEKFLKYPEDEYVFIRPNEIELNLLKNPRILEVLVQRYLMEFSDRMNIEITSFYQSTIIKGQMGYAAFTYLVCGKNEEYKSDEFLNESVRMLHLICRLNKSTHLYDFNMFDILEEY